MAPRGFGFPGDNVEQCDNWRTYQQYSRIYVSHEQTNLLAYISGTQTFEVEILRVFALYSSA